MLHQVIWCRVNCRLLHMLCSSGVSVLSMCNRLVQYMPLYVMLLLLCAWLRCNPVAGDGSWIPVAVVTLSCGCVLHCNLMIRACGWA